jgi:hypothetical protein
MKLSQAANVYIKSVPAAGIILFLAVIVIYTAPRAELQVGTDPSYWGAFGDYVGGILNPLFGILTLIGLVITVWLQMEILEVQKAELAASREELAKSAEALEIQNKTMLSQNFEGTFFRMLQRQSDLLENIKAKVPFGTPKLGKDAIDYILAPVYRSVELGQNHSQRYQEMYGINNANLGPYFRNIYHTLKFIDRNPFLTQQEKIEYSSLFRAQLSSIELALIFHNCLSELGEGLRPLIIKYRMLKHFDTSKLGYSDLLNNPNLYPLETYLARN